MNTISVVIGIFAIGAVIGAWYILQPAVYKVLYESEQFTINHNYDRTESATLYDILQYINTLWGPVLAVTLVVWLLISGSSPDYRSVYER